MRIEILSGTYEIDNEAKAFITAAEEATIASLSQKLVIRQRRQAEREQEEEERQRQKEQKKIERQRQKAQERLEEFKQKEELKRINLSRALDGLPPVYDLSEIKGRGQE